MEPGDVDVGDALCGAVANVAEKGDEFGIFEAEGGAKGQERVEMEDGDQVGGVVSLLGVHVEQELGHDAKDGVGGRVAPGAGEGHGRVPAPGVDETWSLRILDKGGDVRTRLDLQECGTHFVDEMQVTPLHPARDGRRCTRCLQAVIGDDERRTGRHFRQQTGAWVEEHRGQKRKYVGTKRGKRREHGLFLGLKKMIPKNAAIDTH